MEKFINLPSTFFKLNIGLIWKKIYHTCGECFRDIYSNIQDFLKEILSLSFVSKVFIILTFFYLVIVVASYLFFHRISHGDLSDVLKSFGGVFLITNVTSAVFGIGFAFNAYQRSPYSKLLETIPRMQKVFFIFMFLLVLFPFIGFISFYDIVEARGLSLLTIPMILCLSILSYEYVFREVDPIKIILKKCSEGKVEKFAMDYLYASDAFCNKEKKFEVVIGDYPEFPLIDKSIQPLLSTYINDLDHISTDPFNLLESLSLVAMEVNDIHTFELIIQHILNCHITLSRVIDTEYQNKNANHAEYSYFALKFQAANTLGKLAEICFKHDKGRMYGEKIIHMMYIFIVDNASTIDDANNFFNNTNLMDIIIDSLQFIGKAAVTTQKFEHVKECLGTLSYLGGYAISINTESYVVKCCDAISDIKTTGKLTDSCYENNIKKIIINIPEDDLRNFYLDIYNRYFNIPERMGVELSYPWV